MPRQQHSQPTPTSLGQIFVFRCNLPSALFAEWPGSFTCHCGNTGVQHTKLTLEKKILPPFQPGSKSQPFDQESGALTNNISRLTCRSYAGRTVLAFGFATKTAQSFYAADGQ